VDKAGEDTDFSFKRIVDFVKADDARTAECRLNGSELTDGIVHSMNPPL